MITVMGRKAVPKEKIKELAKLSAIGKSCKKIADRIHLHKTTIAIKLKDVEAKSIIEGFQKYYLTYAEDVKRGFMELVLSDDPKVRQKATEEYHKVMGITTPHPGIYIQNLYQTQHNIISSPIVNQLLSKHMDPEVIDIEVIEDKSEFGSDNE